MSDPFRLAVIKYITEGIAAAVTPANGCVNDLTGASFYGRSTYGENDPVPMSSLIEDPREQTTVETVVPGGGHKVPWRLLLQGFVEDIHSDPTGPTYVLAAEMMSAVSALAVAAPGSGTVLDSSRKVNRVQQIRVGAPIVRPPDEFSSKAYCLIPLTLDLFETPSAPFT